ncbi:MAG TPA: SMP-30/gluconolactonase/LRE family protein [Solirubrobacteraceae bacterium]|nr:SMP-30/gluconolactonase/LRE family protein [Solirubrobacteraceae bacterium]
MSAATESVFAVHDEAFLDVIGPAPRLVRVVDTDAHEGPVYVAGEDALYFTTVPRPGPAGPRVEIRRLALDGTRFPLESGRLTTVRADANAANGMTLAPDGRLLVCEQGSHATPAAITLVDRASGRTETLVDGWRGLPLNSPNDVVVKRDGTVWFTDPSYGHLQGFRPAPRLGDRVYRHDPRDGDLAVAAEGFDKPNGLAFSPDERTLYVGDSGAIHAPGDYDPDRRRGLVAFDVIDGRQLARRRPFGGRVPGFPDGIKVDAAGRVYVSCDRGVQVLDPAGALVGEIAVPGGAVNFTFGGPERNVLLITADDAIWAACLNATGPQP